MRTKIKFHLKRLISLCIALAMMLSTIGISGTIAYAAENDFDEVTLELSSNVVNDDTIDLYLLDEVYYISIDDLCRLTRSTKSVDSDVISVTQGIWRAEFDTANQTFNDGYQTVDITVLEISNGDYAVPALMFLSYYKALAIIKNDVLYCELPECTAWEALDLDYSNSLVDIYELYGGEGNVELSLTLDILMDFIMGKNPTTEKYLKSAYYEALDVDIYSYDAVEQYVNERNESVYTDLVAEETQSLLESLAEICGTGDTTNKITQEAMDLYILFHCTGQTRDFYNLAYNAMEIGDTTSVRRYAEQIASVWREGEFQKSLVKNNAKSVEGAFFLLSSAVEAAQQVKYTHQENNLVYRVMGQENMKKLSLDVGDNEWYTVANVYKSTATSLQNSFVNILEDLQTVAINDLVSEAAEKIGVDTFLESAASKATGIKGIKAASWKIGLEVGRGAVQLFSWIDSLAEPDSLVDILFVDVGAYEADRLALYLSELQQNVYWVLCNERDRMYNNLDNVTAYQDYIYAQQLYCRTSIAMYENLIAMVDEFGKNRDYWTALFQERIDMLAVSLYQLTTIQDDGVNNCLPLDMSTFQFESKSLSEAELLAITESIAKHTMENYVYTDMDHDGANELIGVYCGDMGLYQTWYCSSDGKTCALIHQNDDGMDACEIELLNIGDATHVVLNAYRVMGTGKNYSIIAMRNQEIVCLISNRYGYVSMTDGGDITLNVEAYDGMYDPSIGAMILHTWKNTYLFFDGNTYKEYGATEISEQEFLDYQNSQELKDQIEGELRQSNTTSLEFSYFKRKNGIMHIQCNVYSDSGEIQYGYYTIRYNGNQLNKDLGEYNSGQMASSFSDLKVVY